MSAESLATNEGPDEPATILRTLPESLREQFLVEYTRAVDQARDPAHYPALRDLLRIWRLHALAVDDPGYAARMVAAPCGDAGDVNLDDIAVTRSAG